MLLSIVQMTGRKTFLDSKMFRFDVLTWAFTNLEHLNSTSEPSYAQTSQNLTRKLQYNMGTIILQEL